MLAVIIPWCERSEECEREEACGEQEAYLAYECNMSMFGVVLCLIVRCYFWSFLKKN